MVGIARLFHVCVLLALIGVAPMVMAAPEHPQIEVETTRGTFVVELYPDKAPRTVENFINYVKSGYYSGTVFHRAVERFLVQGGGLTETLEPKPTADPIPNESRNGLSNDVGTVAMARGLGENTATSQFFVNLSDNKFLNHYRPEAGLEGYTVFGRVVKGLEVLLSISNSATQTVGKLTNVPVEPPVIRTARLLDTPVITDNAPPPAIKVAEVDEGKSGKSKSVKKGKRSGKSGKTTD